MHLGNLSRIAVTNMSLVLQNFEHTVQKLQSASRPSFLTPFPFVNIGSFSPTTLPAANPVKRILLYFTPSATFPLQIKRFFWQSLKKESKLIYIENTSQVVLLAIFVVNSPHFQNVNQSFVLESYWKGPWNNF